jgi:NO-binding membrane sensor protein with MHYT domain
MDQQILVGTYEYPFVALSILIAVLAAYAALDLVGRIAAARGRAQYVWLFGGAIAMGTGIWAMHYIGMVATHPSGGNLLKGFRSVSRSFFYCVIWCGALGYDSNSA